MAGDGRRRAYCRSVAKFDFRPVGRGRAARRSSRAVGLRGRGLLSDPLPLSESAVPTFPHGVRLRFDDRRGGWVLLAPERVLKLDGVAAEIAKLVDGARTIEAIVDDLSGRFEAERAQISRDVRDFLAQLAAKRMLQL